MKKLTFPFMFLWFMLMLSASQTQPPKLIVGIVVDQMREEYLTRFYHDFSKNGFKRMLTHGFHFTNTHFNYMPTFTAPGHSSVYTGTTPQIHGIVGNGWYNKALKKKVYCAEDETVTGLGDDGPKGKMSPRKLLATTITDEVKLANPQSKVIGISIKDRGAILPAGHFADAAYWINSDNAFISSSYYMDKLPSWVTNFNQKEGKSLVNGYLNAGWTLLNPPETYTESLEDNNPYEYIFKTKTTPTFPYDLKQITQTEGLDRIQHTPYGNDLIFSFAKQAIVNESLGQDDITDFLALSFSSTDIIGHAFGPRSREVQDAYLRLDLTMANLLAYLDQTVGKNNYLIFLTADHACGENPLHLKELGYDVRNLDSKAFEQELKQFIQTTFGEDLLENYSNQNIFLNETLIAQKGMDYNKIISEMQRFIQQKAFVKRTYSRHEILASSAVDYHLQLISLGYDPKQNGDIVVLLDPAYMEYVPYGTTHGTTYAYDTFVPNLWFGWGIKPGISHDRKVITQLAPTLSQLLGITFPNGSQGYILNELFE